jgi:hypothetical protein
MSSHSRQWLGVLWRFIIRWSLPALVGHCRCRRYRRPDGVRTTNSRGQREEQREGQHEGQREGKGLSYSQGSDVNIIYIRQVG